MNRRNFSFTDERKGRVREILKRYPTPRAATLPLLWLVHEQEGWMPDEALCHIAELLGISSTEVLEVASFCSMFEKEPPALHHIKVCQGICCRLKGSDAILNHLEKRLGIDVGQASGDSRFRLSAVECLGMCGTPPSMMIGDECFEDLTEQRVDDILGSLGLAMDTYGQARGTLLRRVPE